jgi:uncharacterized protein (TIGR02118 family)
MPTKFYELLPKRPDLSDEDFHEHWRYRHAPFSDPVSTLLSYVQSHREPFGAAPFGESPYEGVAEAWFDSLEEALALGQDPAYTEGAAKDEPNFLAMDELRVLVAEDRGTTTGSGRPERTDRVKLLCFLRRGDGTERDAFEEKRPGADALGGVAGVEQVVQSRAVSLPPPAEEQPYDGVDELFFADAATASERAASVAELLEGSGAIDLPASLALVVKQVRIF